MGRAHMTRKAYEKIREGLEEALEFARHDMTGFFATLTPEQQAAALAYRGPENIGRWLEDPRVQESLRRNHAKMKAKLGR
jgi:hypothetical protein